MADDPWSRGREYVRAADGAAFYRFDRHCEDGWATWFRSPTLAMRWEVETSVLTVNDINFILSLPVLKRDDPVLLARAAPVKWADPLLRPTHVCEAEEGGSREPGSRWDRRSRLRLGAPVLNSRTS